MRLLEITNDFPPTVGGIENYIYSLMRRWPPQDVTVLTRWVPGCESFDGGLPFEVIREPVGTLLPTFSLARKARALAEDRSADVVHFASSLPLGLLGARIGLPYCVSVHGGEFRLASVLPIARRALRRVIRGASMLMPQSSFAETLIDDFAGPGLPMTRITCGVDLDKFTPPPDDARHRSDKPVVLSVSRLVARKGPATLITAMPQVLAAHPSASAVVVGGGPDLQRLRTLVASLGVVPAVDFTGPAQWAQVSEHYARAAIFALPTRERFGGIETEGLPLVFVEAAAAGLPLIGGKAGGVGDAVREGETGFLVDGRDPQQTARAIIRLLDDEELARDMGRNARRMAETEFDWDLIAKRFRDACTQATA